jgi:hypothetical protein
MRWAQHVACIGNMSVEYNILVGNPEEKKLLEIPRHKREDVIEISLRGMECTLIK